jgi:hypothetical protein
MCGQARIRVKLHIRMAERPSDYLSGDAMTAELISLSTVDIPSVDRPWPNLHYTGCAHARVLLPGECSAGELVPVVVGDANDALTGEFCGAHLERGIASLARRRRDRMTPPQATGARRLFDGETLAVIRDWALAEGLPVSASGGLSGLIIEAYRSRADAKNAS